MNLLKSLKNLKELFQKMRENQSITITNERNNLDKRLTIL